LVLLQESEFSIKKYECAQCKKIEGRNPRKLTSKGEYILVSFTLLFADVINAGAPVKSAVHVKHTFFINCKYEKEYHIYIHPFLIIDCILAFLFYTYVARINWNDTIMQNAF
jgi:hypothetical protein